MKSGANKEIVDSFGAYLMERSFDPGIDTVVGTLEGKWRSEQDKDLSRRLQSLTPAEREAVVVVVRQSLIAALHGLMHGLSHDKERIRLTFDGEDVAAQSDGLHGDLFFWMRDLSRYPYDWEADL